MKHSVEQMNLLLMYYSVIGIWIAIPSVNLFIRRDKRWPAAFGLLFVLVIGILICYLIGFKPLFPDITLTEK